MSFEKGKADSRKGVGEITKTTHAPAGGTGAQSGPKDMDNAASGSEFMTAVSHSRMGCGMITKSTDAASGGLGGGHGAGVNKFQEGVGGNTMAGVAATRSTASSCATKSWPDAKS